MTNRLELVEQEKVPCKCKHLRSEHWVGGHISDCQKCKCMQYTPSVNAKKEKELVGKGA